MGILAMNIVAFAMPEMAYVTPRAFGGETTSDMTAWALGFILFARNVGTPDEVRASAARHRSPLVLRCIEDHLAGRRLPLDGLHTHPSVFGG